MKPGATLYYMPSCPHCHAAMDFLRSRGIEWEGRDVENDQAAYRELKGLTGKGRVPVLRTPGKLLEGFDREAWAREFPGAGPTGPENKP